MYGYLIRLSKWISLGYLMEDKKTEVEGDEKEVL